MKILSTITWLAVGLWMAVIFYLSHQVAAESSELSSGLTRFMLDVVNQILPKLEMELEAVSFFVRKAAHFTAYFILGVLLLIAIRSSGLVGFSGMLWAFVIAVIYAISDEVPQLFIPGRSGEIRDVLIDSTGAIVGIIIFTWGLQLFEKKKRKTKVD